MPFTRGIIQSATTISTVVFDKSKNKLFEIYKTLNDYVKTELLLTFKQPVSFNFEFFNFKQWQGL